MNIKKFVCIHGHFYQPPRENPWLEDIETQQSAAPFHDWNERVNAECYAPNTAARILDGNGKIIEIINNYEFISFNFGPTLIDWLDKADPDTVRALRQADQKSKERLGFGNAMAQVYNHIIMPLANRQDKITQVKWGIRNFEYHFKRQPEGMWLAETAVDLETLDILAQHGILFTILAPRQAAAVRPGTSTSWQDVRNSRVDPKRPYYVSLPSGGKMALFFYDGPLSQAIAFEGVLNNGQTFADRISGLFDSNPSDPQLVHMATDGESYGHHHRFGEMALAYALKTLHKDRNITVTNYAAYLHENPPTWEVQIIENSSWSCIHGVERWRSDCGCGGHGPGWSLAWRAPLRQGFDKLRDDVIKLMDSQGREIFKDPWEARNEYVEFLLSEPDLPALYNFLEKHQLRPLEQKKQHEALKLLACARYALYMFTSCGWFFDDMSGLEAVQNLCYAARCLELANSIVHTDREEVLLHTLDSAQSNFPTQGSGRDIWRRYVTDVWLKPAQVAAEALLPASINGQEPLPRFHCYLIKPLFWQQRRHLNMFINLGAVEGRHIHLLQPKSLSFVIFYVPDQDPITKVGPWHDKEQLESLWQQLQDPFINIDVHKLRGMLSELPEWRPITMNDLSTDARQTLAEALLKHVIAEYRKSVQEVYMEGREAMRMFREINLPVPKLFASLAETVIADQTMQSLKEMSPQSPMPGNLSRLAMQAKALGLNMNFPALEHQVESILERESNYFHLNPEQYQAHLERISNLLGLSQAFNISVNLWRVQNNFYQFAQTLGRANFTPDIIDMGRRLGFIEQMFDK